ncbi:peptidase M16 domain protein [Dehalogenimonas lykanthroporepellens BL-DC-9]|nr:peptidase M16 domain protein [Dehalogenimonas lykanthroporepellens BL-DC-9]
MYRKTTLPNGLRILTQEMPHTLSSSICVFVGTSSRYEPDNLGGVSHFIEHMLFRGTEKHRTAHDISEAIEGVGGIMNGGTDKESTVYWAKVASSHFMPTLDTLADMMLHSRFDPEDLERERQVIIEEIHMTEDQPDQKVCQLIDSILWPNHPLGRDIAGTESTIRDMGRADILNFMSGHYRPDNTVVSIAGGLTHEQMIKAVIDEFGEWESREPSCVFTGFTPNGGRRMIIEHRDIEQAYFQLAMPAMSTVDPRRYTQSLLNVILGEGMSSRLFTEIRDKLGLAYAIQSYADFLQDTGALTVAASVDTDNLEQAVAAVINELEKLKTTITRHELNKARELSKGRMALRLEDSRHVATWLGGQEILAGEILTPEEVITRLDKITLKDITDLAEEIIQADKFHLAVVGPVADETPLRHLLDGV